MEILFYLSLFALGALDALQPGHAKALVSSALVGSNANIRQVFILGIVVTLTHTLVNTLLAFLVTTLAITFFQNEFIRYIEIFTGIMVIGIAIYLIWQRFFKIDPHCCHAHHHEDKAAKNAVKMSFWEITTLGLVSGLTPCPVVLTALISAIAVGKGLDAAWGILIFSMGMGAVLIGVGLITLYGVDKARHSFLTNPAHLKQFSQACAVLVLFIGTFLLGKCLFFYEPEKEASMMLFYKETNAH
jgi:nickel/cobalt transporter (NicO) family protein